MKLIRFGQPGEEKPGVVTADGSFDVSAFGEDYGERFFETNGLERLAQWWAANGGTAPRVPDNTRLGAPIQGSASVTTTSPMLHISAGRATLMHRAR